jgi:hypothetical protein
MSFYTKIVILFYFLLVPCFYSNAEYICSAEVRYQWNKVPKNNASNIPVAAGKQAGTGKSQPTVTPAEANSGASDGKDPNTKDVFFSRVEVKGENQESAKAKLDSLILEHRVKADTACRELHENQSKCLSIKFSQSATIQGALTFSQRKELERKMVEDCEVVAGTCLGSATTEPICKELVSAEPTPEAAPAGKGKDAKKK